MKRPRLLVLSLLTLLVALGTLAHAGWLHARHGRSSLWEARKAHSFQGAPDPLASSSARRWQQGLPSHWRACLLQR